MSKMIQLRNVPEALHMMLKARASLAGMSPDLMHAADAGTMARNPNSS